MLELSHTSTNTQQSVQRHASINGGKHRLRKEYFEHRRPPHGPPLYGPGFYPLRYSGPGLPASGSIVVNKSTGHPMVSIHYGTLGHGQTWPGVPQWVMIGPVH